MTQSSKKNSRRTSSKSEQQGKQKKQQKKILVQQSQKRQTQKSSVKSKKNVSRKRKSDSRIFPFEFGRGSFFSGPQSSKKRKKRGRNYKKLLTELLLSSVIAVILVYAISLFTFALPKVSGYGMMTVLEEGDRLFVNRLGKIDRFSLVYFRVPGRKEEVSIRRVVGLPGEEIAYKEDRLWVNGEEKVERFLIAQVQTAKKAGYQLTEDFTSQDISGAERGVIPEGKYLVLGDNRTFASDSRFYGLVDEQDIVGVATMKLFPLHEMMKL
ncbi:signal peptidase I [Enterococcus sp. LJL128]